MMTTDTRPVVEAALVEAALAEFHGDGPAPSVVALQQRGTPEGLATAETLCRSPDPNRRALGAHILGQLHGPDQRSGEHAFPEQACDILLALALDDPCLDVRVEAIFALGHLENRRSDEPLAAFSRHPDRRVRHGLAFALRGGTSDITVRTLLGLMDDPDVQTRDWATTGIGGMLEVDGPEIRAALLRRTEDEDEITRAEALHGLARRGDRRAVPHLIAALSGNPTHPSLFMDAAEAMLGLPENVPHDGNLLAALQAMTGSELTEGEEIVAPELVFPPRLSL